MNELRDQLWDFVYGLLEEAEAANLRQRITSDRQVAREYARVKLQSELLAQAARANQAERELPQLPDRPAKTGRRLSRARLIVFSGSLALSLGLLLFAGVTYWSEGTALRGPAVAQALEAFEKDKHPRMVVVGPQVLQPDTSNTYEVTIQSLDGEALRAPVTATLQDLDGNELWNEALETSADGKQTVELPADKLHGQAVRLKIAVEQDANADASATNGAALETWLPIQQQRGELAIVNEVTSGTRTYFREADLSKRAPVADDDIEAPKESSRSATLQRAKGSSTEDQVTLEKEAEGVRFGFERFYQADEKSKYQLAPIDSLNEAKPKSGDTTKQLHEALSGPTNPARTPAPNGKPGADSREEAYYNAPAPSPRNAQPLPAATPESAEADKKDLPAQQPAALADAPVTAPAMSSPEPAAKPAEADELALSKVRAETEGRKVLLESITANEKVIASRMVDGSQAVPPLEERIDELRREKKLDDKFSGRIEGAWYDATVAPPQKIAEATVDIPGGIEPLNCTIHFDRPEYRAGDLVTAELHVTDSADQPLPAVLNVQVDALPLSQSDAEDTPPPTHFLFINAQTPPAPLVFDNAVQQAQSYQQSLASELKEQRQTQRRTAWLLLAGSGIGIGLLLLGGFMKWLPRARYWLPIAGLLGCTGLLGAVWLPQGDSPPATPAAPAIVPLTTYGVRSQPPTSGNMDDARPNLSALALGLRDRSDGTPLTREESRLPVLLTESESLTDSAQKDVRGETRQLYAMADWDRFAESGEGRELALNSGAKGIAAGKERAGKGLEHSYFGDSMASSSSGQILSALERYEPAATGVQPTILQTLYWHPRLMTDSTGVCRVQFPAPPGPLAHRLTVIGHGEGRVGTASQLVPTVAALAKRSNAE
jgi:hypothetical protein